MATRGGGLATGLARRVRGAPVASLVALGIVALCALHFLWLARYRSGFITELDESGYIARALEDARVLPHGASEFLRTAANDPTTPPVVPLSTVPFILLFGRALSVAWAVIVGYFALLVAASYALARRMMAARWAALAALCVATAPIVSDYARIYHFSLPAAALLTGALWALLRANGERSLCWALLGGVLIGLMVQTRTMTLAYVPGVALGLAIQLLALGEGRRERIRAYALTWVAALAVAAPWYGQNFSGVADYLTSAGYGSQAQRFGAGHALLSWGWWTKEAQIVANYLFLPESLAVLLAFASAAVAFAAVRARSGSWRIDLRALARSDAFVLSVVVLEGYLALSSSANAGTAFALPWLPALLVLAVAAAAAIPSRAARGALALCLVGCSAFNLLVKNAAFASLSGPSTVSVPVLGTVTVADSRDVLDQNLPHLGYPVPSPPARLPGAFRRWLPFDRQLVGFMIRYAQARGRDPWVVDATGDGVLTDTRIFLASELWFDRAIGANTPDGPDTVASYDRQLRAWGNNFLLLSDPPRVQNFQISPLLVVRAALDTSFRLVATFTAPDGRKVELAWRDVSLGA